MKSNPKPSWYTYLEENPFRTKTFTESMAAAVRRRAASPASRPVRRWRTAVWTALAAVSVCLILAVWPQLASLPWPGMERETAHTERVRAITFYPSPIEALEPAKQKPGTLPAKSVDLPGSGGRRPVSLHFYEDAKNRELVTAFLEEEGQWYSIGLVSNEGLHLVDVTPGKWGDHEIWIKGPVGEWTMKLIRYDSASRQWSMNAFEGHLVQEIDLDGDGVQELVSPEERAVPPMVTIHTWNRELHRVESAIVDPDAALLFDIDRNQALTYSYLFSENGQWYIEFGAGTTDSPHFLQYRDGMLLEVKLVNSRSRLREWLKKQNPMH